MRRGLIYLIGMSCVATMLSTASAQNRPKLDEVLKSINESTRGTESAVDLTPFLLVILAAVLVYVAVKHWNRRQTSPKVLNSHTKLIKETASASGVSARTLKNLEQLAKAQGLSSPLVAVLCPSAITTLARNVKTDAERKAVSELAGKVLKP